MILRDKITVRGGAFGSDPVVLPAQVGVPKVERLVRDEVTEAFTHDESLRALVRADTRLESAGVTVSWRGWAYRIAPIPGIQVTRKAGKDHHMTLVLVRNVAPGA